MALIPALSFHTPRGLTGFYRFDQLLRSHDLRQRQYSGCLRRGDPIHVQPEAR